MIAVHDFAVGMVAMRPLLAPSHVPCAYSAAQICFTRRAPPTMNAMGLAPLAHAAAPTASFWIGRSLFMRWLGGVYCVAWLAALLQNKPLLGDAGILPIRRFLNERAELYGERPWRQRPSLFWLLHKRTRRVGGSSTVANLGRPPEPPDPEPRAPPAHRPPWPRPLRALGSALGSALGPRFGPTDRLLDAHALCGLALAVPMVLTGGASALQLLALYALYLSVVSVGQRWYSFGWESLLLETGFLGLAAVPMSRPPSSVFIWAARWLLFRVMLGAGLIKLRSGDPCWRDLTAMDHFYETQPVPNPLSRFFHRMPGWWHRFETWFGLWVVEIATPWLLLLPTAALAAPRALAAAVQIGFQFVLITTGNLAFLNWLTITPAFLCLSDAQLPTLLAPRATAAAAAAAALPAAPIALLVARAAFCALVVRCSAPVVSNMLQLGGKEQRMNAAFGPLRLVNSYGAFGTVTKERYEVRDRSSAVRIPVAANAVSVPVGGPRGDARRVPSRVRHVGRIRVQGEAGRRVAHAAAALSVP